MTDFVFSHHAVVYVQHDNRGFSVTVGDGFSNGGEVAPWQG